MFPAIELWGYGQTAGRHYPRKKAIGRRGTFVVPAASKSYTFPKVNDLLEKSAMRMPVILTSCLAAGVLLALPARSPADDKAPQPLPLKKVVLFNSGVGFFEHDAEVQGDQKIELKFNVDDINDLLKSMVLQDLGGGRISTVTYASKDPITKTLSTFAVDLTNNPSLADLLAQVRGEKIELETPKKIVGTLLGIERRKEQVGKDDTVEKEYANLLTDEGLRSVSLASVGRIKILNEHLDGELRQALAVLAMGHDTNKKSVTLNFLGAGKRPVRVGYIQQAPIWKTSYRLVLKDQESPLLQGWAIVENTTEHDWKDVRLTLVSGRPISFVMNLYDPLYINRPVVEPELFASLRPQTYGQDLAEKNKEFARKAMPDRDGVGRYAAAAAAPAGRRSARRGKLWEGVYRSAPSRSAGRNRSSSRPQTRRAIGCRSRRRRRVVSIRDRHAGHAAAAAVGHAADRARRGEG